MPTYVYKCTKCSNNYEKKEGFDAPPQQKCPKCGGKAQRVIHAPPIVFKGSGFYKTDSRKAPAAESESSSTSDGKSSDGASSDAASKGSSGDGASTSSKDAEPAAASSD
ncbi:MAG: FmdB family transcriptional regulator [Chloroflexi bacterium]|nr:FmdB family transcriptional regulator [Chloroflexota bacterium]